MIAHTVTGLILAAGKGTRMKSARAKVLHEVFFKPMIHHVLDAVSPLHFDQTIVVTGHQAEMVEKACSGYPVAFARQDQQLGTGHAVLAAESVLGSSPGDVMILCGDTPLIRTETLRNMLSGHRAGCQALTVMTTYLDNPANYGRILPDGSGHIQAIVEEKDASPEQKEIKEINAGIYCVDKEFLFKALKGVGTDNKQGEIYLTDIIAIAHANGLRVQRFFCHHSIETLGINSRLELSLAHATLQKQLLHQLMDQGVTLISPETITVHGQVKVERDTIISPNVFISGNTTIGYNCRIAPFCYLRDCRLGDNVSIGAGCYLHGAQVGANENIDPHSRIIDQIEHI
ncbi:MAG: bifunctional N-acetylglucosamine-1-phosphate uridyltransferase/glucosamine-1-phosphate acetyltransferase [Deltaproteobacteria bacterium]|nr:bifunctional N-acetylglucosamine-1-phosphate uridyltransferase/glucosamine-1-phosphate acetyltransferase [Deltaproteobacteria bacterium]